MSITAAQMVADARSRIGNLSPGEVAEALASGEALLIDLREPAELAEHGLIPGAIHAPRGMLEFWADTDSSYHRPEFNPERRVILYCASGGRSALAADTLRQLGYRDVDHLNGGLQAWKVEGRDVEHHPARG